MPVDPEVNVIVGAVMTIRSLSSAGTNSRRPLRTSDVAKQADIDPYQRYAYEQAPRYRRPPMSISPLCLGDLSALWMRASLTAVLSRSD
jgi:hypothetical protein